MFTLIVLLNFVAVVLFDNTSFTDYGPLFVLPFVAATAYAIVKHRLLDIRLVILRTLLFSALSGGFFVLYGLLVYIVTRLLMRFHLTPLQHAGIAILAVAIAVGGFHYFRLWLQGLTDRFLFKGRYNYRQTLRALGKSLSETIELDAVLSHLTRVLLETVKVNKVLVFIRDAGGTEYRLQRASPPLPTRLRMTSEAPLIRHLKHQPGLLVRDEINFFIEQEDPQHNQEEIQEIKMALTWLDAALVVPLVVKGEISGLLILGDKRSGDPFSSEDLELLATLGPQAATAIENARLYRESQEFAGKLEVEVARATSDLRVANEQLAQLDRAKSEFLSIASHQLYTPLTALKGYLSMVQEGDFGAVSEKQRPVMDILRESSDRLIDLIRNLLDVSRIESGRLELSLESVDLVAVAQDLVRELTPNANRKRLTLTFHGPANPLPHVVADTQRLRQVLLNILDNGIKYTEKGKIDVRVVQDGNRIVYSVQDTGKGIAANEIDQLFTKFTRVGGSDRYHTEGTGLGLYVARQIVREHRGDILVESPGRSKGSTFFVKLPIEGATDALKAGTKHTVGIKAAEAGQGPEKSLEAVDKRSKNTSAGPGTPTS